MSDPTRSPRRAQGVLLAVSLLLYVSLGILRPSLTPSLLRDTFPSLLFFPAAFSLVGLAPPLLGGAGGRAIRKSTWMGGTFLGIGLIEGLAPALGHGTADLHDALALFLGAVLYALAVSPR